MSKRKKTTPFSKRTGAGDHEVGYGKPPKGGQFKPGKSGNPSGRPKGAKNKLPQEVKAMILQALQGAGGVEYLQERANDPRTASAFMSLVGKVLPLQVTGEGGGAVRIESVVRRIVDPNPPPK